jgi:acyl-CoA dehydrogenase
MPEINAGLDAETFEQFITTLRRFIRERLIPAEPQVFEDDRIPEHLLNEMREMGLMGLSVPEAYGGPGLSMGQYLEAVAELAYAAPAFRSAMAIGTGIITTALKLDGTEEQRQEYLPRLVAGDIASFCLTEPDSGSDSAAMKTRAVKDGDFYVLNGSKRYITNAPQAKFFLVMARTSAESLPGNAHVSGFLIPVETPGLSVGKPDKKMGQRGALTADVVLEDVRVPASALLGGVEGKGFKTAMKALDGGRLSVTASAIGLSRRILDSALRYATERKAFGETISNFQLVQAMLADSKVELYAAECMLRDATAKAETGVGIVQEGAACKIFSTEALGRIADRCVQIYGGAGYMAEYDAERLYRDARVFRIYEGTTQILQLVVARAMLKEYAAGL